MPNEQPNSASTGFQNRREFFRLKFATPVRFKSYAAAAAKPASRILSGATRNISQSGILFQTSENPPQLSSVVWMNLDLRTLRICQEIEERALVFNNGLLGRVVRVEEDTKSETDGAAAYDIGVCFVTQDQKNSTEIQQVLSQISKDVQPAAN